MIEEFKDILIKYLEIEGKVLNKNDVIVKRYEQINMFIICNLETSFFNLERYEIIYNITSGECSINTYKQVKTCRLTKNEE